MEFKTGEFVWFDLPVANFETAKTFYGELFGWRFEPMGEAKKTDYWFIKTGNETVGGLRRPETAIKVSDSPVMYFAVETLDPAVTKAKKLGATLVGERVDIPGDMGCFHLLRDKDQNLIGLWAKK